MRKKLRLETLRVDSFETGAPEGGRGTVHGHAACTCFDTCLCKTAYYHCGTGPHTIYSCDYTNNESCLVTVQTVCTLAPPCTATS